MRNLIGIASVLALIVTFPCLAAQELHVVNAGFEQVEQTGRDAVVLPAGWRARGVGPTDAYTLSEKARSGRYAAQLQFSSAGTGYYYSEPQPLPPCSEVTVSAWVNVEIPADQRGKHPGAFLRLMFQRQGKYVRLLSAEQTIGDTDGEWVRMDFSGIPPPEADGWRMSVEFQGIGTARYDDVSALLEPLPRLSGANLHAPSNTPIRLGDGYGILGPSCIPDGTMQVSTTIQGHSAVAPGVYLGVVWYNEGRQVGLKQIAESAWMEPTDASLDVEKLAGADTMRPVVYTRSADEWEAVTVTSLELTPPRTSTKPGPTTATLRGHPRLFVSQERLQRLRKLVDMEPDRLAAEQPAFAHHLNAMLKKADRCFEETEITVGNGDYGTTLPPAIPSRHLDNFPYWTALSREIEARIENLAAAYLLTGERKYADLCKKWTLALCEWPQWTDPDYLDGERYSCLDTGHFCHAVAVAYDFLYDTLSPQERKMMRDALLEKGAKAVMKDATAGWVEEITSPNGFALVMGGMGIAAAATYGDDPDAEMYGVDPRAGWYLNYARRRIGEFFDSCGVDGGHVEGHTYGGYAMSHLMPFAATLAIHGDDSLVSHPYIPRALRFITYCLDPMSATSVSFCDSHYDARGYRSMAALLAQNGNGLAHWYLAHDEGFTESFRWVPPLGVLWLPLEDSGTPPEGWLNGVHFRDIGWIVARSGFADQITPGNPALLFAMRSGYFGPHCQPDCNSFMLNINGHWILQDPDSGKGTTAHSTLLVNGEDQVRADGHMRAFGNVGPIVYAVGDASACYPDLKTFDRHAVMVNGEYVVVVDDVQIQDRPVRIQSQLVTGTEAATVEPDRTVRLIPDEGPNASDQALSVWLPTGGEIATSEHRENVKVINHYQRGGLKPMLLWPHNNGPDFRGLNTVGDDVCCMTVRNDDTSDYILLNVSGEMRTITAPEGAQLRTDARLVWIRKHAGDIRDLAIIWGSRLEVDGTILEQFQRKQDFTR